MHTFYKGTPDAVALPSSAAQVQAIVRACRARGVPIVPRGSGTGLIGGAMAARGGVMVGLNRMNAILDVDLANRCATVQPGLINLWLTNAVRERGWFFAPDPSSQMVSSIGGNVSTNAGGPHCLKYGITTNHVLGLDIVTGAGDLVHLGSAVSDRPGYDLVGAAVGAEGTFGLVTSVTVRLLHAPDAVKTALASFTSMEAAAEAVSAIIAAGMLPAALEMLDEVMIGAINAGSGADFPATAAAVLLIELDGPLAEVEAQATRAAAICRERGAIDVRVARDDTERALLWKGRKEAAGAVGRLAPTYLLQDAVVPRSKL
ncbi:MAG: FAD-binding protein, partial [Candidatus Rokubacteria bacterium]|nr:FAD-binding protein [Candidatus Rokubacteria bacterium]